MALLEILTVGLGPRTHIRMSPRAAGTDHWAIHVYIGEAKCRHRTLVRFRDRFGWKTVKQILSHTHPVYSLFPLKLTNNSLRRFPDIWAPPNCFRVFLSWRLPYSPFSLAKTDSASCLLLGVGVGRLCLPKFLQ